MVAAHALDDRYAPKDWPPERIAEAKASYADLATMLSPKPGRGKSAKSLQLIELARAILEEIQPASVRAVCYRLFTGGATPNMSKNVTGMVSKQLVWAREQEIIPWEHIVDETREAECIGSWNDPESLIQAAVHQYRKDYWAMQPNRVEVWSEKGTVRGTLAPILKEFGVTFRVMHGYGSATTLHSVAQEDSDHDKPLTVLYAGDWDPSGLHMSMVDLPARLDRYGGNLTIKRVALDEVDTDEFSDLPFFLAESKAKDARFRWFTENYGDRCWELDALSPVILRERMRNNIIKLLDVAAWNHAVKIEAAERESMSSILTDWKNSISRPGSKYLGGAHDGA
jgi:hypothetical protein